MANETRVQVLKESERNPETTSFMWLFRTGEDGESPIKNLEIIQGALLRMSRSINVEETFGFFLLREKESTCKAYDKPVISSLVKVRTDPNDDPKKHRYELKVTPY